MADLESSWTEWRGLKFNRAGLAYVSRNRVGWLKSTRHLVRVVRGKRGHLEGLREGERE